MTQLQEEFLSGLKSNIKFTEVEYAALYNKYCKLAIEKEKNNGASEHQAKAMGNYYIDSVLSGYIGDQNLLDKIIDLKK